MHFDVSVDISGKGASPKDNLKLFVSKDGGEYQLLENKELTSSQIKKELLTLTFLLWILWFQWKDNILFNLN